MEFSARASAKKRLAAACLGALLASGPWLALRNFTVDDALIPARFALSLARGEGYRPSVGAPPSDGVTPLGFAHLLAPFASDGVLAAHEAARWLGAGAWLLAAGALGASVGSLGGSRWRYAALALFATSAPLGGWAASGLETGLVAAAMAWGAVLRERGDDRAGAFAMGLAAAWRPELLPVVAVLGFAAGPPSAVSATSPAAAARRAVRVGLALGPALAVALTRLALFGRTAPLSIHAKVPVLAFGLPYAAAAALLAGFLAVVAPVGLRRGAAWTRILAAAVVLHVASMALAGGDWMPLARLAVPVAPLAMLTSARLLAQPARRPAGLVALVLAVSLQVFGFLRAWPAVHAVEGPRRGLIEEFRPHLATSRHVAGIDIGWIGAAAEHARLVDLAGVTDPEVAALGGGHTARRIPRTFLEAHDVDALVMQLARGEDRAGQVPWTELKFARGTEMWIARSPGLLLAFELQFVSETSLRYVLLTRRPPPAP